jgi:uncharacterized small protein (DUF1192 family)
MGISNVIDWFIIKRKEFVMFDEEGRKIDFGYQIGMDLKGMSVDELKAYIDAIKQEIIRAEQEVQNKQNSAAAADAFFK